MKIDISQLWLDKTRSYIFQCIRKSEAIKKVLKWSIVMIVRMLAMTKHANQSWNAQHVVKRGAPVNFGNATMNISKTGRTVKNIDVSNFCLPIGKRSTIAQGCVRFVILRDLLGLKDIDKKCSNYEKPKWNDDRSC